MKALKSIFSALLALVILVSSTSFTIDHHICMGRIHSTAILHDAAPCAMEMMAATQEAKAKLSNCCKQEQIKFEGNDYRLKNLKPVSIENQSLWIAALPRVIEVIATDLDQQFPQVDTYRPPLLQRDVPVLIQSFLI
ncbi:MAG: hypothetical protein AB7K37_07525 [Cyclobacteriaceae bacterium]